MSIADTSFQLNTGAKIPALGLGTWQSSPGEVAKAVRLAISVGYRHIDAAMCYDNEREVGEGIKDAIAAGIVKREDLFVTTKLWCTYQNRVEEGLSQSLENLMLDYVDLYLVHWPVAMNPNGNHPLFPKRPDGSRDLDLTVSHTTVWKKMEEVMLTGKTKAIGVSNHSVKYLEELLSHASIVPAVNQIENHPCLPQQEIVDFCKSRGIHITAYSPLGGTGSPLFEAEPIKAVARSLNVTPASVLLSWHVARGSSVLGKSVTPARIEANRKDLIKLEPEHMETIQRYINELRDKNAFQRFIFPPFGLDFGFPDKVGNKL